jgi:phospholipid/cholesterol/gamma-HCH transport system permease protein
MLQELLALLGRRGLRLRLAAADGAKLINDTTYWMLVGPWRRKGMRWGAVLDQMVKVGTAAIPIVCLIALFMGVILALQAAYQLRRVGAIAYVADLVGVSITRELGPLMTAIVVAGRSGSAFTAEIGFMRASAELDALIIMGVSPVKFLVVPRVLALIIMVPCLVMIADIVGVLSGAVVGIFNLNINPATYYVHTTWAVTIKDVVTGLTKSLAFAAIIGLVGCYQGLAVSAGAEEVGQRTTRSVVNCIFIIIAADFLFTLLFYLFG